MSTVTAQQIIQLQVLVINQQDSHGRGMITEVRFIWTYPYRGATHGVELAQCQHGGPRILDYKQRLPYTYRRESTIETSTGFCLKTKECT